jgi:hypothetical protein
MSTDEEMAYRKLNSNTKILELENLNTFLYKTKCKWEQNSQIGAEQRRRNTVKC